MTTLIFNVYVMDIWHLSLLYLLPTLYISFSYSVFYVGCIHFLKSTKTILPQFPINRLIFNVYVIDNWHLTFLYLLPTLNISCSYSVFYAGCIHSLKSTKTILPKFPINNNWLHLFWIFIKYIACLFHLLISK